MITYDFYVNTYLGRSIPEGEWPLFAARAQAKLNHYKRIYTVTAPEENSEAMAVCAMADTLAYFVAAQNGTGGVVAGASIGSVSVSYATGNGIDTSTKAQERELYQSACEYLSIYRGVGQCEC